MTSTRVMLIYDIVEDRRRTKIADACLDYGLDRVQYSAFAGLLTRTHQEELMLKIRDLLADTEGEIMLIPIDERAWTHRLIVENGRPIKEIADGQPVSAD